MRETLDERMRREWLGYKDCDHEWGEIVFDKVFTLGARQCLKCKCWRGLSGADAALAAQEKP